MSSKGNNENDESYTVNNQIEVPSTILHNISDMEVLRFNSADAVRQTMKRAMAKMVSKNPQFTIDEEATHSRSTEVSMDINPRSDVQDEQIKNNDKEVKKDLTEKRKRPGRPRKAITKKQRKKDVVSLVSTKLKTEEDHDKDGNEVAKQTPTTKRKRLSRPNNVGKTKRRKREDVFAMGRHRISYMEQIMESAGVESYQKIKELALDKEKWRKLQRQEPGS